MKWYERALFNKTYDAQQQVAVDRLCVLFHGTGKFEDKEAKNAIQRHAGEYTSLSHAFSHKGSICFHFELSISVVDLHDYSGVLNSWNNKIDKHE